MLSNILGIEPTIDDDVTLEETTLGEYTHIQAHSLHFSHKSAEIINLIVDGKVRNCGTGRELLAYFENIAIDNSCVCIEVNSGKWREGAHRLYMREGFECDHYKFTKGLI